jgi:hypothetical protein
MDKCKLMDGDISKAKTKAKTKTKAESGNYKIRLNHNILSTHRNMSPLRGLNVCARTELE